MFPLSTGCPEIGVAAIAFDHDLQDFLLAQPALGASALISNGPGGHAPHAMAAIAEDDDVVTPLECTAQVGLDVGIRTANNQDHAPGFVLQRRLGRAKDARDQRRHGLRHGALVEAG